MGMCVAEQRQIPSRATVAIFARWFAWKEVGSVLRCAKYRTTTGATTTATTTSAFDHFLPDNGVPTTTCILHRADIGYDASAVSV